MKFDKQDNWEDAGQYKAMAIVWRESQPNAMGVVYEANVGRLEGRVRMNDFPDEPLYTLLIGNIEVIHFNEWPVTWSKP